MPLGLYRLSVKNRFLIVSGAGVPGTYGDCLFSIVLFCIYD